MVVKHFTPKWSEDLVNDTRDGSLGRVDADERGNLICTLAFKMKGQVQRAAFNFPCIVGDSSTVNLANETVFGLRKIGPGVWTFGPAVYAEGFFHAWITLIDVPEPAPFTIERKEEQNDPDAERSCGEVQTSS